MPGALGYITKCEILMHKMWIADNRYLIREMLLKSRMNKRLLAYMLHNPRTIPCVVRVTRGARVYAKRYFDKGSYVSGPPVTVIIRITNRCNLRCIQCGLWGDSGFLKNMDKKFLKIELSTEHIKSFIEKIADFHPFISFFGGEPLIRKDFVEIIAFISSKHLMTTMNTNAHLLNDKAYDLVRAGLTFCKVSLDGPSGVNEKIRKGNNSYNQAVSGIKMLISARNQLKSPTPIVQMCSCITKENQYKLIEIAEIAHELGVDVFAVLFGIFTTEKQLKSSLQILRHQFNIKSTYWQGFVMDRTGMDIKAIKQQIEEIKRRKWRFIYRQYPADTMAFDIDTHYNKPEYPHGRGFCIVPWFRMQLMPNGDIALCEDTPDYVAGNIFEQEPMEIWNGRRYRKFRKYILEDGIFPVCSRCSALYEIPHYLNALI